MKKQLLLMFLLWSFFVHAQNVGVGTTTPAEKLEVKNPLRSTLKISSASFSDTSELLLANRNLGNSGTSFSIKNIREEGLFFSSLSDLASNTNPNSLIIKPNGNVGIGIIPTSKFHVNGNSLFAGNTDVNGTLKLQGLNLFEFGAGISGKEINAGKVGYNAFGQNALTFVGAGTNSTNRSVYFFAEGGTIMNGPLNIEGVLKINGNSGAAGQILTSNGAAEPTWANSSFNNTVRFAASFTSDVVPITYTNIYSAIYNNSPADINITTSTITINKTGLYHIEGFLNGKASFSSDPPSYLALECNLLLDGIAFKVAIGELFNRSSSTAFTYEKPVYFSQDIYLTAPAVIKPQGTISDNSPFLTSKSAEGVITGYLISE
jgi:hypothetical protein